MSRVYEALQKAERERATRLAPEPTSPLAAEATQNVARTVTQSREPTSGVPPDVLIPEHPAAALRLESAYLGHQRRRNMLVRGLTGSVVVVALVASVILLGPHRARIAEFVGDLKRPSARGVWTSHPEPSAEAATSPSESTFSARRGGPKQQEMPAQKADDARGALAEIAAGREQEPKAASRQKLAEEQEKDRKLPHVTGISSWNAENYTRVVIDIEDQVEYQAGRIPNPDRIYFDLHKAKLSSTLAGKTLEVQGSFLKRIRVAQNQAGVVRVVLDVDQGQAYVDFLLPNPYRLVVDVYGSLPVTAPTLPRTTP